MTEKQGGSDVRANTTVATPLNGGGPGAEYELDRPQVVLLGADVRRLPRPRPDRRRALLLPAAALDARRRAQRFRIQRLKDKLGNRSNASSEVEFDGAWARMIGEEGARRADDHRDGQPHPARLRDRRRHRVPGRRRAGPPPRRPPLRLRQRADRAAADAQRPRRPLRRVRGGDDLGDAAGPRLRRGRRRRRGGHEPSSGSPTRCSSTGSASGRPRTPASAWSASAATATSRSRGCRASSARAR